MLGFEQQIQVLIFGRVAADLLTPIGIMLSVLISLHVLLHKRDVPTAMGWMGLAWLSPFAGGLLYLVFGVNRVTRRARVLRGGRGAAPRPATGADLPRRAAHLAPLGHASARITDRPLLTGNGIEVLRNGDEAYPQMLEAIRRSRRSVALGSYILRDDTAGGAFIEALIAAHRRGVQVRGLIDGIASAYFYSSAYNRLARARVPVGRFMHSPLPWRMPFLNLRTHKKILVVDGRLGFTGGMNIGRENVLAGKTRRKVRDTHFRLRGPVVGQLTEAFARDWSFVTDEELGGEDWFPRLEEAGDALARVVTSGPDADIQKIEFMALAAIACSRRSVRIQTPYFLPDERLVTALSLAALGGVDVQIVLPERSDHIVMDWALRANVRPLLRHGCRIWLNPPPFDHSKLLVVDDEWCLIGSANWDTRSFRLNFELDVELYDAGLAAQLTEMMKGHRGRELTVADIDARKLPIRLRDAAVRLMLPYL